MQCTGAVRLTAAVQITSLSAQCTWPACCEFCSVSRRLCRGSHDPLLTALLSGGRLETDRQTDRRGDACVAWSSPATYRQCVRRPAGRRGVECGVRRAPRRCMWAAPPLLIAEWLDSRPTSSTFYLVYHPLTDTPICRSRSWLIVIILFLTVSITEWWLPAYVTLNTATYFQDF